MSKIGAHQLAHALVGMSFPAQRWEVVTWAEYNGVGSQVRDLLRRLPDGRYLSLAHVAEVASTLVGPPRAVVPTNPAPGAPMPARPATTAPPPGTRASMKLSRTGPVRTAS
jgi:Protein of unknown function (DUF2795)